MQSVLFISRNNMKQFSKDFLNLSIELGILKFGEFQLKSGRISPYFFNAGLFNSGRSLALLGKFYAQKIVDSKIEFDVLFGPAYKGIPLASATSIALFTEYGIDVPYAFNRKEAKDHGEGGTIVGSEIKGKILIIDDVISAGTSIKESANIIKKEGADIAGVIIALDRQEKGNNNISALQEIEKDFDISVISIANLDQLISLVSADTNIKDHSHTTILDNSIVEKIVDYKRQYGI